MGMIGNLRRLGDADLKRLLEDPELVADYLDDESSAGFGPSADVDVDKAWHGIHFLLTGTAWEGDPPLNFLVTGGAEIGDVDVGYGPARGFGSAEVAQLASALGALPSSEVRRRFLPDRMMELDVYPSIWDRDPEEDDTVGYLLAYYEDLRAFVSEAAAEGQALLVYLT